jgi:hypothetical protein
MKKEFKEGDLVYFGVFKGEVTRKWFDKDGSTRAVEVEFENSSGSFDKDGRIIENAPILISDFPYGIKMISTAPINFNEGDNVYFGLMKGVVLFKNGIDEVYPMNVKFETIDFDFTLDGRILVDSPIVLSYFPYEFIMEKINI